MTTTDALWAFGADDTHPFGLHECVDYHHEPFEIQGWDEAGTPDSYGWWRTFQLAAAGDRTAQAVMALLHDEAPSEFELICQFNLAPGDFEVDPPNHQED
jgi:hypothetical protein